MSRRQISNLVWIGDEEYSADNGKPAIDTTQVHFVLETGTARPRGSARSLIRSHARQKTSAAPVSIDTKPKSTRQARSSYHVIHFLQEKEQGARSRLGDVAGGRKIQSLGAGLVDPFNCLPFKLNRQGEALLDHFKGVCSYGQGMVTPRNMMLSMATLDAASLNVALLVSALDYSGLFGQMGQPNCDLLYYKVQTIRAINSNLINPEKLGSDPTILAVSGITLLESLSSGCASAKVHLDGLEMILQKRGGLCTPDMSPVVRRQAAWADSCSSFVLETPFRFHNPGIDDIDDPADWAEPSPLVISYQKLFLQYGMAPSVCEEVCSMFQALRNMAELNDIAKITDPSALSSAFYKIPDNWSDYLELLERRMIVFIQTPTIPALFKAFGYAMFIHSYMFLHQYNRSLTFFFVLSSRLQHVLSLEFIRMRKDYAELLLWSLLTGGICAAEEESEDEGIDWYTARMSECCKELGVTNGDGLKAVLKDWLWSDLYRSPLTWPYWKKLEFRMGSMGVPNASFEVKKVADDPRFTNYNALREGNG